MSNESEITFLDALDYCEVHGHHIIPFVGWHKIDIIGTIRAEEACERCGKTRYLTKRPKHRMEIDFLQ